MISIKYTLYMEKWLESLKDQRALARIVSRIERIRNGNFGDVKPVGSGVSKLRVHYGSGYRIYFVNRNNEVVILLCGGDKNSQQNDIQFAKTLAKEA